MWYTVFMRFGKLNTYELQRNILDNLEVTRKETILSASQGEDCAALKAEGFVLVSSDPITCEMPIENLGSLSVDVCCNDIVANGGEPLALMLTIILPPSCGVRDVDIIVKDANFAAKRINVDIVGGHTEFSDCVTRPIVSATAIGSAKRLLKKADARIGDKLYVTKFLGMEGSTIIADNGGELTSDEQNVIGDFRRSLSVYPEGKILRDCEDVSFMHDVTEGGILGAVREVCFGRNIGADIYEESLPVHPLTKKLCKNLGIDVYRFISSGSMLFAAASDKAAIMLEKAGIKVTQIGALKSGNDTYLIRADGAKENIEVEPDQMYKINKTK